MKDKTLLQLHSIMKRILTGVVALAMAASFAAPLGAASAADIQAQIAALTAQLSTLNGGSMTGSMSLAKFNTDLTLGSKNSDVSALQALLISKGYSIPAGATGYFGAQTKTAVMQWQAASGITPAAGYFGPKSRAAVNAMSMGGTTTGGTSMVAGCVAGAMFSSTTGAACAGSTTTGGTSGSITTPGVEGILTVTAGPITNTVVNVGQTMVPVLTVRAQAQTSDISVGRVQLDLGPSTNIFKKIYQKLYVVDTTTGTVLASTDLNNTTVVQSGNNYLVTISGFSAVVPKGTYKDLAIKADLFGSISSTYTSVGYTISVDANGVRGTDGAGIDQYGPSSAISQQITVNNSLVDNAIANLSLDSSTPQANSVPVSDTTNGQYLKLPVLVFSLGAQNDGVHIHNLQVAVMTSGTGAATAAYLYQGSTQVSSASITNGYANFTNITDGTAGATVPVNTSLPYTVKVDVTGVTTGTLAVTASTSKTFAGTTIYNSDDSTITTNFNGSATGNTQTVLGKGPALTLNSASIAVTGQNQNGGTLSTSTITATFSVSAQSIGADTLFGTQASSTSPMFTFKGYNGSGAVVASNSLMASTSGFIVPTGAGFTTGVSNTFTLAQQQSGTLSNITFSFAGKDSTGQPLTAGPYSVGISAIQYVTAGVAGVQTQNYMDGLTSWRTAGISPN